MAEESTHALQDELVRCHLEVPWTCPRPCRRFTGSICASLFQALVNARIWPHVYWPSSMWKAGTRWCPLASLRLKAVCTVAGLSDDASVDPEDPYWPRSKEEMEAQDAVLRSPLPRSWIDR